MSILAQLLSASAKEIPPAHVFGGRRVVLVEPSEAFVKTMLNEYNPKGVLVLDTAHTGVEVLNPPIVRRRYRRIKDVHTNNCEVAVLNPGATAMLTKKHKFQRFKTILVPGGASWFGTALCLLRYGFRGDIGVAGVTDIPMGGRIVRYTVLNVQSRARELRRQYAPAGLSPLEILRSINELDVVLLRGAQAIAANCHSGDIDLLISARHVDELTSRFEHMICTYPIDIYTHDGSGGYTLNGAPYYAPDVAEAVISSAVVSDIGIKIPAPEWQFLSYCYHLLFHGKINPGAELEPLSGRSFKNPENFEELQRVAGNAGQQPPETVDELEAVLRNKCALPSLDLIGFYSNSDPFLRQRFFSRSDSPPGLSTFFLRDFDQGPKAVEEVRRELQKVFEIVAEGPVTDAIRHAIRRGVRGGNWTDKDAKGGTAEAIYWFVCWDRQPRRPSFRVRRKYPRLDNEHVRIKDSIRSSLGKGHGSIRGLLHSSDNTREALDHMEALGLLVDPVLVSFLRSKKISIPHIQEEINLDPPGQTTALRKS